MVAVSVPEPTRRPARVRRDESLEVPTRVQERAAGVIGDALASARSDWPAERTLTWWTIDRPALVLGSAQESSVVDHDAAAAAGVELARRASGGGAVLLVPDEVLWCDLVVPAGDPRADLDVVRAARWVGDAWVDALRALGVGAGALVRHEGGLVRSRWSDLVCFAGVGPGEVLLGGRKVVGISQRRSRHGARFQIAVLRRWRPALMAQLIAPGAADGGAELASDLAAVAVGADRPLAELWGAFAAAIQRA